MLGAMLDALKRRFGGDYRLEPHLSSKAALDAVSKHRANSENIALVIAHHWMPEMTGHEFLWQERSSEPSANRTRLIQWGDHEASPIILPACTLCRRDDYLYKPWAPAEVHRYPYMSEFLTESTRLHRSPEWS